MVVIAPLIGLFLLIMMPVWRDDARFDDFHERVLAYPLPPRTQDQGGGDATFGKISGGNGDYCEYRVQLVLQTGLSQGEIRTYYDKARIRGADDEEARISLRFGQDTGDDMEVTVEFSDISPSDWDFRCT
ncbi:hypothetical protein ACFFV7_03965 [Nonomuraea spiralis]|uniref:Uncharacterized protein n=1 Tax=Nonomuraea spiralis TaxID=46182 RepID=A0ABV5I731_9ACTN|nr:hypothetical protein [Nonomuraea spiralis]